MRISDSLAKRLIINVTEISDDQMAILEEQLNSLNRPLQDLIIANKLLSERDLTKLYADKIGLPYVDISPSRINREHLSLLPERLARKYKAIVFDVEPEEIILVAMEDPENDEAIDFLKKQLGERVKLYLATTSDIDEVLDHYRGHISSNLTHVVWQDVDQASLTSADQSAVSGVFKVIIENAVSSRASSIHIEPRENFIVVRFRVDGALKEAYKIPKKLYKPLLKHLRLVSDLKNSQSLAGERGQFSVKVGAESYRLSIVSLPTVDGSKLVVHIASESASLPSLEDLGFWGIMLNEIRHSLVEKRGLILLSGPNRSGKSTAIYSILSNLNEPGVNIASIEDPIKHVISGVSQVEVSTSGSVSFASGLKALLQHDPDVIGLSQIKDANVANLVVEASAKHLILAGINAQDSLSGLSYLVSMGVEPYLVAANMNLVISGRLVRRLCPDCRQSFSPNRSKFDLIEKVFGLSSYGGLKGLHYLEVAANESGLGHESGINDLSTSATAIKRLFKANLHGCSKCNYTGYSGRIGIYEVLKNTDSLQKALVAGKTNSTLKKTAIKEGMTTLRVDGLIKALRGYTSVDEVQRNTN